MRLVILALFLAMLLPACSNDTTGPKPATGPGELLVYIWDWNWGDGGSPDKLVEVVETGSAAVTDSTGTVAFVLEPGTYTVLAHEITGSITTYTAQRSAVVRSAETTRVEIHDCVECLAP